MIFKIFPNFPTFDCCQIVFNLWGAIFEFGLFLYCSSLFIEVFLWKFCSVDELDVVSLVRGLEKFWFGLFYEILFFLLKRNLKNNNKLEKFSKFKLFLIYKIYPKLLKIF